jgi:hypothetical protein
MNQRWLAKRSSQRPVAPRTRDRKNKYGRRGRGNGCGHDPRKFLRPQIRRNLPPLIAWAIEAFESRPLPSHLMFRFASRSERDESVRALVLVMLASTCVVTQRIGRPSRKEPGGFEGLTIDYHLAPMTGVGESRLERAVATLKDWGWNPFKLDAAGRRCPAQPIDETETGERRGCAAIRAWTPQFWRDLGISQTSIKQAVANYVANLKKTPTDVPVDSLVGRLAETLAVPRERPPP